MLEIEVNNKVVRETEPIEEKWTIMIYMAGDNNLSADMAQALEDIKETASQNHGSVNIFVYYDSIVQDAPTFYFDFTEKDKIHFQLATQVESPFLTYFQRRKRSLNGKPKNENSAAMFSIMNFVNWCVNDTKTTDGNKHKGKRTDKYALIFSGHSSSFQNLSLMIDSTSNYYLTIPKLSFALNQITKTKNHFRGVELLNQKLDILGFDSCTMGLLELGYQFKNYSNILIASEGNIPNAGWSYGTILTRMISETQKGIQINYENEIAKLFIEDFINKQNEYIIGGANVDISAWDLTKVKDVVNKLDNWAKYLNAGLSNNSLSKDLINAIIFSHWKCQSYMSEQHIDLKDFCEILAQEVSKFDSNDSSKIIDACSKLNTEIDNCVLLCGFSGGQYQYSNGIGLYFPWNTHTFAFAESNYHRLLINQRKRKSKSDNFNLTEWHSFLFRFLTQLTLRKPRPTTRQTIGNAQLPGSPGVVINPSPFFPSEPDEITVLNDENLSSFSITSEVKDNPRIPGSRDNPRIPGSRDNPNIPGSRDNPRIPGSRGFEILLGFFKNIITPWNISGFTKSPPTETKQRRETNNL